MSQERTEAVVLRGVDFSETSRIVTFLTPDRGRLACLAKGVRRKGSPLTAVLDTLNRVEIIYYWKGGRGVQPLGEAALLDGFGDIKRNLKKNAFAAFPLEIALLVAHENEPSQPLYATLIRGMTGLAAWTGDVRAHACWQVVQLLTAAGFEPGLDACVECGARVAGVPGFSYSGGVTCPACRADQRLLSEEYAWLRALMRERDRCPPMNSLNGVYRLVREYARRQLEADLRSVRVIDEIVAGG
jgi:DNA repair protein RecO (recombination protein O)